MTITGMFNKLVLALLFTLPLAVQAEDFKAGKDYEVISTEVKTRTGVVPVAEFFSYGCPWCSRINDQLTQWTKSQGKTISFSRVPVVFHKEWTIYAKAYYTAKLLGIEDKISPALFKAIQDNKNQTLTSNQAMIAFFKAEGVDEATAKSAFENSTLIDLQVKEGLGQMARLHVSGVPAIVVNEQYKTDLQMAKGQERLFKILDFLVAKSKSNAT